MPTNLPPNNAGEYGPPAGDIVNYPQPGPESVELGYETTDVNVGGVAVFLGGLFTFVLIFFFFCFLMGKAINSGLNKQDGPTDKWHQQNDMFAGAKANGGKRENLKSNTAVEQQELAHMATAFPAPRLDADDGNQSTADLHAREDLLLDHYSTVPGQPTRIPIERAMELIAQRGLPVAAAAESAPTVIAETAKPMVQVPLTSGFARTGYELDTMEARHQKMEYGEAKSSEHADLKPAH